MHTRVCVCLYVRTCVHDHQVAVFFTLSLSVLRATPKTKTNIDIRKTRSQNAVNLFALKEPLAKAVL